MVKGYTVDGLYTASGFKTAHFLKVQDNAADLALRKTVSAVSTTRCSALAMFASSM